jgi:hypothetical protein
MYHTAGRNIKSISAVSLNPIANINDRKVKIGLRRRKNIIVRRVNVTDVTVPGDVAIHVTA